MKKILVSACLMGYDCRYKGDNCKNDKVLELANDNILIPVCPEQLGGLPTPRYPAEKVGDSVIAKNGADVTEQYTRGAELAVKIAQANKVDLCILKANSPSCGKGVIYDGTFSGAKTAGNGVTAEKLLEAGFEVISENGLDVLDTQLYKKSNTDCDFSPDLIASTIEQCGERIKQDMEREKNLQKVAALQQAQKCSQDKQRSK